MLAPFTLDVYRDDLARIVQSVFSTMMDIEVAACDVPWTHSHDTITSAVHFVGVWRGATLVEVDAPQAFQFAARFMGIEMPVAIDDDVRDVMGELANMVAGNLKSLLPHGVDLSMPSVVVGSDYSVHICGVSAVERMTFSSAIGNFRITLIEMLAPLTPP
ncbi:MAG: chemotaxis protein CheX [Bryobacteraceae bacterium]|jgi:chemotaxis protein CheX